MCVICHEDVPSEPVACESCKKCIGCLSCLKKWSSYGATLAHRQCPLCRFSWRSKIPKIIPMIIRPVVKEETRDSLVVLKEETSPSKSKTISRKRTRSAQTSVLWRLNSINDDAIEHGPRKRTRPAQTSVSWRLNTNDDANIRTQTEQDPQHDVSPARNTRRARPRLPSPA